MSRQLPPTTTVALCLLATVLAASSAADATERGIDLEVTVNADLSQVWHAWTTEEGITGFLAPAAHVELRVDGPYEIFFNPFAQPGLKGADGMRILAFQEPTMLSFTWNAPPHLPEARKQRTHVTVRLVQKAPGQTVVRVHHDGWGSGGEWDKAFEYFSEAWGHVLRQLKERFAKGPKDWTEWLNQLRSTPK